MYLNKIFWSKLLNVSVILYYFTYHILKIVTVIIKFCWILINSNVMRLEHSYIKIAYTKRRMHMKNNTMTINHIWLITYIYQAYCLCTYFPIQNEFGVSIESSCFINNVHPLVRQSPVKSRLNHQTQDFSHLKQLNIT